MRAWHMQRVSILKRFQTILCKIVAAIGVFFKKKLRQINTKTFLLDKE